MQSETTPYRPSPPPLDAEGFVKSFSLGDLDGAAASFDELGFVVIDGVLSEAERMDTINDIWAVIEGFCAWEARHPSRRPAVVAPTLAWWGGWLARPGAEPCGVAQSREPQPSRGLRAHRGAGRLAMQCRQLRGAASNAEGADAPVAAPDAKPHRCHHYRRSGAGCRTLLIFSDEELADLGAAHNIVQCPDGYDYDEVKQPSVFCASQQSKVTWIVEVSCTHTHTHAQACNEYKGPRSGQSRNGVF